MSDAGKIIMVRQAAILTVVACCLSFALGCAQNGSLASSQFRQLLSDEWEYRLRENPLFATYCGDHRFNDKLPLVSEADQQRRLAQERVFLERLLAIDRAALAVREQTNYDIFRCLRENTIAESEFFTYLMPITHIDGFHTDFPEMPDRVPLNTIRDYENYISRLNAFNTYTGGHIELMRSGIRRGFVLPAVVAKDIENSIRPHIVPDANQSLLFKPFRTFPDSISKAEQRRLTHAGASVIMDSVAPAYQSLLEFVTEEYVPAARSDIAASSLPTGRAFYEHRVRYHTTLDITPQQVHDIGLSEVKRIKQEMMRVISEVGFEDSFEEFVDFLHTDKRFYVDTPDGLLKETSFVLKKVDGELPRLFKTLPRTPFGIKEVPDYVAPESPGAYYLRPPGDGSRAGFYYINTYDLNSRPLYMLEALSLHESMPGHHLQIALQQELSDIPAFRRFSGFTVFAEGWALYAEKLGLEMGLYQDPNSNFGRLTLEMWRACRLVVDTGIHYFGWSRQEAIDFMTENTGLPSQNIATEVDRYIVWPGQALAYKIGELEILALRAIAEEKLGAGFDVREFHDVVLGGGSVPLDVLERNVNFWIATQVGDGRGGKDG
jgi:uncharacterized protein (DUF885 family)